MSLFSYMSSNKPFMQTMSMKSCEYVKEFHNPKQYIKEVERLILDHM